MPWAWTKPADLSALTTAAWVRRLDAGEALAPLGFVRVVRGPSWLGCGPRRLDVCETEDAALLMSIEQGWFGFGHWRVIDAERCRVGAVVGRHLLDEQDGRFATFWHEGSTSGAIRGLKGRVYAELQTVADGAALIRFAFDLDTNPFLRMVLLAACILSPKR